jgi:hypothetical protein
VVFPYTIDDALHVNFFFFLIFAAGWLWYDHNSLGLGFFEELVFYSLKLLRK